MSMRLNPKLKPAKPATTPQTQQTIRETDVDYDGDGDVTEGIKGEVDTLAEALYAQIQIYATANGGAIVYNGACLPVLLRR